MIVLLPAVLAAQRVSGTVRTSSGVPSAETSVVLVSDSGAVVAGMITHSDGSYSVVAPRSGTYRVRARRMGFSPDSSSDLKLTLRSPVAFDPTLTPIPRSLAAVVVSTDQRCVVNPAAGASAFRLWEAAQNALSATVATSMGQLHRYTLHRFERELDPGTARVRRAREWDVSTVSAEPYVSVSAESLAVNGFVRTDSTGQTFYAPDARTLTSETFATSHCLRPVEDNAHAGLIGLAFAPVHGAKDGDVEGTLWLDRTSSELKSLEFSYTRKAAGNGRELRDDERASGRLEYERLPSGEWIVRDWMIRVPVLQMNSYSAPSGSGGEQVSSMVVRHDVRADVTSIWEIGGDVRAVVPALNDSPKSVEAVTDFGVVRGSVIDSGSSAGIPNIGLTLVRATSPVQARTVSTGVDGRFAFDSIAPGEYLLRTTSARLDTLYTVVQPTSVDVAASTQVSITIVIPPSSSGRARLCPDKPHGSASLTLHGTVSDSASGAPVRGARVTARWMGNGLRTDRDLSVTFQDRVTETDSMGKYVLCGLPMDQRLMMSAEVPHGHKTPSRVDLEPVSQDIRMLDMGISAASSTPAAARRNDSRR